MAFHFLVVFNRSCHSPLRVLRGGALESPNHVEVVFIYFLFLFLVVSGIQRILEIIVLLTYVRSGIQHFLDEH